MVRTPAVVIGEIEHSLDEVTVGWVQKEDWRIKLGISDARRELEELSASIEEVSGCARATGGARNVDTTKSHKHARRF